MRYSVVIVIVKVLTYKDRQLFSLFHSFIIIRRKIMIEWAVI